MGQTRARNGNCGAWSGVTGVSPYLPFHLARQPRRFSDRREPVERLTCGFACVPSAGQNVSSCRRTGPIDGLALSMLRNGSV
jgi:hypothetical protein